MLKYFVLAMVSESEIFIPKDNRFTINGPVGDLELMTRRGQPASVDLDEWLVVVCHPHPDHGGTMDNKVVATVARAARDFGLDSLRFNYRGVGNSQGSSGNFDGECLDFDCIIEWLRSATSKTKLILVGFSFGSAVVAVRSNQIAETVHSVLIAPPIERYPYPNRYSVPISIIQGAQDEVVDADAVTDWVKSLNSIYDYYYSSDTSHFFHGKLATLKTKLTGIFSALIT